MENNEKIFFENEFGKIYDSKILIIKSNEEINIRDISFICINAKDKINNNFKILLLLIIALLLIEFCFLTNILYVIVSVLLGFIYLALFVIFYNKKSLFIKVVLKEFSPIIIKINEQNRKYSVAFIQNFKKYRIENPDIKD